MPRFPNTFRPSTTVEDFWSITQPLPSGARERDCKMRIGGRVKQIRHASKHLVFLVIDNSEGGFQALLSKSNYEGLPALESENASKPQNADEDVAKSEDAAEDAIPPAKKQFQDIVKLVRRGDWVGLHGFAGKSGKGEASFIVTCMETLAPCEVNLPEPGQLRDTGLRAAYKHRDMVVNGDAAREALIVRSHVLRGVRSVMEERRYIEVETPILQAQAGGASAKPFVTHAEATNRDMALRIAPELPLKTLVVGGMERVYEMGRVFRNEGMDATHNPEFTTCEAYGAYDGIDSLIELTEAVVRRAAKEVATNMPHQTRLEAQGRTLRLGRRFVERFSGIDSTLGDGEDINDDDEGVVFDLKSSFQRVSIPSALEACLDTELPDLEPLWDAAATGMSDKAVRDAEDALVMQLLGIMRAREIDLPAIHSPEKLFDTLISTYLEQDCVQPTLLMDHPTLMSPLARGHDDKPWLSQRFELFMCGRELCNAYAELNDPAEQRKRFESQARAAGRGDDEAQLADEVFLGALQHGLPPTGGWGLGIDRLVMLLSEKHHIRDVIAFPMTRR